MPYASTSAFIFGDGDSATDSTETGSVTFNGTSYEIRAESFTSHALVYDEDDLGQLHAVLVSALAEFDRFLADGGPGPRLWDIDDTSDDDDPRTVRLNEDSGTLVLSESGKAITFSADTVRGLVLGLALSA